MSSTNELQLFHNRADNCPQTTYYYKNQFWSTQIENSNAAAVQSQPRTTFYVEFGDQAGVFEKPAGHLAKISHLFNAGLRTHLT